MDPKRYELASKLFAHAVELDVEQRAAFLDEACGDDRELRTEVESLLAHDGDASRVLGDLEAVRPATRTSDATAEATPDRIGPYRILQLLGEGGMGEVYLAEQEAPIRRKLAVKVIKPGMDSKQVIARFESERQALALMDHPGIAKIHEAGTESRGRSYFAMEFVQGVPITQYCDTHRLTTNDRLELFLRVCDAVQHAHQKGVIHRDLKPSNVLVTLQGEFPVPKIIDFGVAKATAQRLTEQTVFTQLGAMIGTPEYMSPEQAEMSGLDVDTRSDVYSLGVLLYEMLVGALPFDPRELRSAGFDEIRRRIREDEPSKPSVRVSTLGGTSTESARRRRTDVVGLRRMLRGDLDWITMKALEKDRTRRYQTATELAADIRRHLDHEPVVAGPPSAVYRTRKFVRRHRAAVGFASVVVLLLAGLAVSMTMQAVRIARERDRANREAATAEQVSEFLVDLFGVSEPVYGQGETVDVREILDEGRRRIERELDDEPEVRARLMHTMGRVYGHLGLSAEAVQLLEKALEERTETLGPEHPATLETAYLLAWQLSGSRTRDKAERLSEQTLSARRRVLGEEHPATLRSIRQLGNIYRAQRRFDEAERLLTRALEAQRRVLGEEHLNTRDTIYELAVYYRDAGQPERAETLLLEELEFERERRGEDHPYTLTTHRALARLYATQGRHDDALRVLLPTLPTHERVFGLGHRATRGVIHSVATAFWKQGRFDEAERIYRDSLDRCRHLLGSEDPTTLWLMHRLALLYNEAGRHDASVELLERTLELRRNALGDEHPSTLASMNDLGRVYNQLGRADLAEPLHLEALETRRRVLGEDDPQTLWSKYRLAQLYADQGRYDEAERLHREALAGRRLTLGEDDEETIRSMNNLAWLLLTRKPPASRDAEAALAIALEANERTEFQDPGYLDTLALGYHLTGNAAKAIETQKKAISLVPEADAELREALARRLGEFEKAADGALR